MDGLRVLRLRRPLPLVAVAALAGATLVLVAASAAWAGTTLQVCPSGCAYTTIQAAIDAAANGDTIQIAPGTYPEQLTDTKSLTLVGAGLGATVIAPTSLAADATGMRIILTIGGSPSVSTEVSGLTIKGPVAALDAGIFVRDGATANIHDNVLKDIRESVALSGVQRGTAIRVGRKSLTTIGHATVANNVITGYQKGGIVVDNTGTDAVITGNIVTGEGPTTATAQNGIQVSRGASASVNGNTVSGDDYTPSSDFATGILLYQSGAVTVTGNTVRATEIALWTDTPSTLGSVRSNNLTGNQQALVVDSAAAPGTLEAAGNWWGSLVRADVVSMTAGTVNVAPWCTDAACSTLSNDANLTSLSSVGAAFVPATTSYALHVGNDVTGVPVTASAGPGAGVVVAGGDNLAVGANTLTVTVTSADGTVSKTYTVLVARAAAPVEAVAPPPVATAPTSTPAPAQASAPAPAPAPSVPVVNDPASTPGTPGASGSVTVSVAAPDGTPSAPVAVVLSWTPEAFAQGVTVTLTPILPASIAAVPAPGAPPVQPAPIAVAGGFSLGKTVVELTVTNADGTSAHEFGAPLVIHISAGSSLAVPAYSQDEKVWTAIPALSAPDLPAGQRDGYVRNADGSIDIYTRHATYFGLLSDTQAPTAPKLTGRVSGRTLRLSWSGAGDNIRVTGYVVSRNGVDYKAGVRTVLVLPLEAGRYRVAALDAAGNKSKQSATITVARQTSGRLRVAR